MHALKVRIPLKSAPQNSVSGFAIQMRVLAALSGCFALLAVGIGALSLLGASWPRRMLESWINIHALFGFLLFGVVLARCWWSVKQSPALLPADIRLLSRHLSRIVYLLLYLVIAFRQIIGILNSVRHGGLDFNLLDEHFRNGPDHAGFDPKDDFQLFLATGLTTIILVRVLAFGLWLRSVEHAALPKAGTEYVVSRAPDESRGHSDR